MLTLLVLGYAYIVWLFTAHNPMPHLNTELIILIIPEAMLEIGFILGIYFLVNKIKEVSNNDR
jgi:hypothetical protein